MKQPIPKNPIEVLQMLNYFEKKKEEFIEQGCVSCALGMSSQIHVLKWAYNMLEEKEVIPNVE